MSYAIYLGKKGSPHRTRIGCESTKAKAQKKAARERRRNYSWQTISIRKTAQTCR
jgi:hypothetical protein